MKKNNQLGLKLIAIFKLIKGILLLIVGIGALTLVHKDVAEFFSRWGSELRIDPDNRFIHSIMLKLDMIDGRKLHEISAGTFFYSALLLTEGIGLILRKRWAEYFTVIVTASFIPLEVYELFQRVTVIRIIVFVINIAVVWYLVRLLFRERK